jgi:hypothetical protein
MSPSRLFVEQVHQRAGRLARIEKGHGNGLAAAKLAFKACAHLHQREAIAQVGAQFAQAQSRRVQAASAVSAEVVRVIDIAQQRGFELGIIHALTIARGTCGALVDISYSVCDRGLLYGTA